MLGFCELKFCYIYIKLYIIGFCDICLLNINLEISLVGKVCYQTQKLSFDSWLRCLECSTVLMSLKWSIISTNLFLASFLVCLKVPIFWFILGVFVRNHGYKHVCCKTEHMQQSLSLLLRRAVQVVFYLLFVVLTETNEANIVA